ncbi:MAG TPA: serine hydrolase domain-containing protein [Allosphingosinicella sp.]
MPARRFALLALAFLALVAGLAWAAMKIRVVGPSETAAEAPESVTARNGFEAEIAERSSARSVIDYRRLDERLRRLAERPTMVGLSVGVIENGEIRFLQGYGTTASDRDEPVTVDTVFRWASLSKGVAGDMVALLHEDRALSLSDPVARWASSMRLPGGAENRATLEDLLSHRLGLFGHAQDSKLEDNQDPRFLRSSLATLHMICPPATCHAYQNVAFDAASEVVERVAGRPYREVVRERLFVPLGMNSASMTRADLMASRSWARGHAGGRNSRPIDIAEAYYRVPAAGGVNSSIKDLALWMRAQMGLAPDVLSPEVLRLVQTPRVATPGENRRKRKYAERIAGSAYGLGWRSYDYAGHRVVGHHGGVRGYRSLILFDPERRSGVVALWNSSASQPNGLEFEVMDMLYSLPFRDWMQLDSAPVGTAPAAGELPDNALDNAADEADADAAGNEQQKASEKARRRP